MQFRNRTEAGRLLASKLAHYANCPQGMVLALPRGGVPVAYEVARALSLPLDVFIVRKLGVPGQEELAMGALASGGVRVLNDNVVCSLAIPDETIEQVTSWELRELQRREQAYRGDRLALEVTGLTVILVDDGVATGSTMLAALTALRQRGAARLIAATPVIAEETSRVMSKYVDEVVAVLLPHDLQGVGRWYLDFTQTTDEQVRELLSAAAAER